MKERVFEEILHGFLEHSSAKAVLRDAVALVKDHSNVLCSDEMVFTVFSLDESPPDISSLVKRNLSQAGDKPNR